MAQDLNNRDISSLCYLFEAIAADPVDAQDYVEDLQELFLKRGESEKSPIFTVLKVLKEELPEHATRENLKEVASELEGRATDRVDMGTDRVHMGPAFLRAAALLRSALRQERNSRQPVPQ